MRPKYMILTAVLAAIIALTVVAIPTMKNHETLLAAEGAHFLEAEAGPALYVHAGKTLNLASAKSVFRNVEYETPTYVIGSMSLPSLPGEDEDVHVYVHVDGWIVVYYLKHVPLTKIVSSTYWSGGQLIATKLDDGMNKICDALVVLLSNVKKYHFKYPEADSWQIVARYNGTFNMQIPGEFIVYERSYYTSYYRSAYGYWAYYLNGSLMTPSRAHGYLTLGQLPPDQFHAVGSYGSSLVAIGLVYKEP